MINDIKLEELVELVKANDPRVVSVKFVGVKDISFMEGNTSLRQVHLSWMKDLSFMSVIVNMRFLEDVSITDSDIEDLIVDDSMSDTLSLMENALPVV
jgi:hypothetical protein